MKKKLIAMLLTLTMLASLLAGCGSGNAVSKGSDSSEPAQNSEAQSDSTEVDLSEKITVSIFQQADDVTMEEYLSNPVLLYWQDMFNLEVDWQLPPQGSEQEQLTMMLGTGDYTDVINASFSTENLATLCADGVIYELSDYIEKYMPNYTAFLNDPANADVKSIICDEEGHIYNIAQVQEHPKAWGGLVYRRDILETMTDGNIAFPSGNDEPTTVEDMDYMLELMKQYFDAAGMTVNAPIIIPACGYFPTGEFLSGFGVGGMEYVDNDGTVRYGLAEDNFYNYLVKMKEWYDKGYLYADFASRTQDMFFLPNTELTYGGAAGVWYGITQNLGSAMSLPDYGLTMDVQPMASPADTANGIEKPLGILLDSGRTTANSGFVISTACPEEKIARILTALDYFFTEEGAATRTMGLSAEQGAGNYAIYTDKGATEGARKPGTREWTDFYQTAGSDVGYPNLDRMPGISIDEPARDFELVDGVSYADIGDKVWTKYGNSNTYPLSIVLPPEDAETANTINTNIQDYANSMITKFIMGKEELTPETFAAYKAKIESLGLADYLSIKQAAYDSFMARAN